MNEVILLMTGAISLALVILAWKIDRDRLHGVIVIFLILIAITGGKIVEFFGHMTNTGNIFYASVFLATYFLIERYGAREGFRSIGIGVVAIVFFSVLARLAVALEGSASTALLSDALHVALAPALRLAIASLAAFVCSQSVNVSLYVYLKARAEFMPLWLRANTANLFGQIVDSAIFFSIAFWGVVAPAGIVDVMLTGLVIKILYVAIASPLLYFNGVEEDTRGAVTTVRWR